MPDYKNKHGENWVTSDESALSDLRKENFWKTLEHFVPISSVPFPKGHKVVILDVGCGECEEGAVLNAYFGSHRFGQASHKAKVIGIDSDAESIKTAVRRHRLLGSGLKKPPFAVPTYQFILGNAAEMGDSPLIPGRVDVVLMRHQFVKQDYFSGDRNWALVLGECLKKMDKASILIITSFSDDENKLLMKLLSTLEVSVEVNALNPHRISLRYDYIEKDVAIDRFVTVVRIK